MLPSHDIFKIDSDGSVLWRGTAESLVVAKLRIQTLARVSPGDYLVLDQHTGDRLRITIQDTSTQAGSVEAHTL